MVANKRRGRPPIKASSAAAKTSADNEVEEVKVLPADEDKEYYFKSKFRQDVVTLIKPSKKDHKDGSTTTDPGAVAGFDHHGWKTTNAHHAGILRHIIEDRPEIGIQETTPS